MGLSRARLVALLVPLALLAGAWGSQLIGGLAPCEMCHWQRWPHYAAVVLAALAFLPRQEGALRALVVLAAVAIIVSGAIGLFHAGVEYRWWQGITPCTAGGVAGRSTADILADIMATPLVRCDVPQWTLWGVSLAGWNALISFASGALILWLTLKPAR